MKLKVLKVFHDDKLNRRTRVGETITVTDAVGGDLIRLKLGEAVTEKAPAKTDTKPAGKAADKAGK